MRISFYTIDDLRLGHDPKGVTGWRLSQFLNWRDALEHYHSLPNDRVKEFGLSNGVQVLQLVRCLPLFPTDRTGYDVLLRTASSSPFGGMKRRRLKWLRRRLSIWTSDTVWTAGRSSPHPSRFRSAVKPPVNRISLW